MYRKQEKEDRDKRNRGIWVYTLCSYEKQLFLRLVERSCGRKIVEEDVNLLEEEVVEDCEGSFGGKRRAIEVGGQETCAKEEEVRASKRKQRSPRNKKNYDENTKF